VAIALYRKYRSRKLDEIVGQGHVTEILSRSLAGGHISHAYLLTGPKGVGKTSIARILAHEINKLPYSEDASHLDIIEIDAASNNGVEDVRDLRDKVQIAPVSSAKKVYIIDEVHMLSKAAFNALLKTLEEPPEHVVFILATTDADKLPETIVSRTQRFTFRAIAPEAAAAHLKEIAKQEKITIDDDALELIAQRGEGSFRDSISLLDQLRSFTDEKQGITRQLVEQSLGLAPAEYIEKLLAAYEAKDLAKIVGLLNEATATYAQPEVLAHQLTHAIRGQITQRPQLIELLDRLLEVPKSSQPSLKLLTVLAAHAKTPPKSAALSAPMPEVKATVEELSQSEGNQTVRQSQDNDMSVSTSDEFDTSSALSGIVKSVPQPISAKRSIATTSSSSIEESAPTKHDEVSGEQENKQKTGQLLNLDWQKLIEYTREHFVAIYSVLSKCTFGTDGDTLVLYTGNAFYKKKLDDPKHRQNLAIALTKTGAGEPTIETIPTPAPPKDSQAAAVAAIMGGGEEVAVDAQ
jgi:DNA polymerase III subunit gamma/tau